MASSGSIGPASLVQRLASRLRFPQLFLLVALLFLLDLFVPDPFPFFDEVLFGLLTVLLGSLRRPPEPEPERPPIKDVTPREER